uniref:Syndecan domain-containing protein n=1 Tax=Strongyloides papillosus TaxID=174720 RepID=A0A0N5BMU2_STREA
MTDNKLGQENSQRASNANGVNGKIKQKYDGKVDIKNNNTMDHEKIKNDDSYSMLIIIGLMGGLLIVVILIAVIAKQKIQASKQKNGGATSVNYSVGSQRTRKR